MALSLTAENPGGAVQVAKVREYVRAANVKIANVARESSLDARVPFICECGEPFCRGIAFLPLSEFDRICEEAGEFMVGEAHGHLPAVVVTAASWPRRD